MSDKVYADNPCVYCGEKFKVRYNMRAKAKYCFKRECQLKRGADKRAKMRQEKTEREVKVKQIFLTPVSDDREYIPNKSVENCRKCEFLKLCKQRINLGMWVKCEIPSYGDLLHLHTMGLLDEAKELTEDETVFDILGYIFSDSSPIPISDSD